ncbi:MAG: protease complex subunit PrcB family protein, partial [Lachnospiraceae bacterium]|nr:protease complex subunit PrcB family protein [Lachnospiraceae bacterium]
MKKSYVFCITIALATVGLLSGCTNKTTDPVVIEPIETLIKVEAQEEVAEKETVDEATDDTSGNEKEPEKEYEPLNGTGYIGDYKYILEEAEENGPDYDRGWFLETAEGTNECIIAICAGKKSTGGHSINIVDMDYDENDDLVNITVKETSPEGATVTDAFTWPTCYIYFSARPKNVKVVNTDGDELTYQGGYQEEFVAGKDHIAVFIAGAGEISQKTYIYKTDDGRYRYVNVTAVTESWGSTKWKETLKGSGVVDTKEEIVEVAKMHNSCGTVMYT